MRKVHLLFITFIVLGISLASLFSFVIPENECPCGHPVQYDFLHPFGYAPTFSPTGGAISQILCGQTDMCYPSEPHHLFYLTTDLTLLIVFFYIQYMIEMSIRQNLKKTKS